jgi:cytochrome c oxidase subunit IV
MNASSTRTDLLTGVTLLALLALTIGSAYINLGPFNIVLSMTISAAKTALIVIFFMHLRHTKPAVWLCAGAGLLWLGILLTLALSDYLTRGWR